MSDNTVVYQSWCVGNTRWHRHTVSNSAIHKHNPQGLDIHKTSSLVSSEVPNNEVQCAIWGPPYVHLTATLRPPYVHLKPPYSHLTVTLHNQYFKASPTFMYYCERNNKAMEQGYRTSTHICHNAYMHMSKDQKDGLPIFDESCLVGDMSVLWCTNVWISLTTLPK